MKRKAVSLLSGGLDSLLATKLVMEQGIEMEALHFTSPFCNCTKGDKGCGLQAIRSAKELGVKVTVKLKGLDYIEMIRSPKHGYGKNINPCIDCRIFMLKIAREFMDEIGASFVITGEVLGQRPMSQRRNAIRLIERESCLEGLILRPLSAQHFSPTIPETEGIVDRERLLDIAGRSRKTQYELVDSYGLNEFSCPGGGCLLTDRIFADKVRDLLAFNSNVTMKDMALLKIGRHFRLDAETKLILGRNQSENERLNAVHEPPNILFEPLDFKGPTGLLIGPSDGNHLELSVNIMAFYAKRNSFPVLVELNNGCASNYTAQKISLDLDRLRI
jgi:tRNA-uridine 2-sulfurtransferase